MEEQLRSLFRSIVLKHRSVMQNHLDQYDLFVGQPRYLRFIHDYPGITQKELVAHMKLAKETVSVTLKKLEHGGYIERIVNEKDRREKNLFLTQKGNETVEHLTEYFAQIENGMFKSLSGKEKDQLEYYFRIMLDELEKGECNEKVL